MFFPMKFFCQGGGGGGVGGGGVDEPMPPLLKYATALQAVFVWIDFFDLITEY